MTQICTPGTIGRTRQIIVWLLRIAVGATFIMSGLVKSIDLWGFSFKIEEYFLAWGWELPRSLYTMAAICLSVAEFMLGAMLALGCYRRSAVWLLLAMMGVMLPLSLYIYIADPVADCGCFGDFWVISNGATFLKNIALTAALVYLAIVNRRLPCLYNPYIQWVVATLCFVFIVAVGLWGYNVQPLIDFRSFPVGSEIVVDESETPDVEFEFIYEKNGERRSFKESDLPDSTWTFVARRMLSGNISDRTELAVYDQGEDVTEDVIATEGPQMIIVVPDYRRANISYTYAINELQRCMDSIGGSLIEIAAIPDELVDQWRDLSMATYPIYQAEPTVLKELARGVIAAVYAVDGRIIWKRSLPSIDLTLLQNAPDKRQAIENLGFDGRRMIVLAACVLIALLAVILLLDKGRHLIRKKQIPLEKNYVNLCDESPAASDAVADSGDESLNDSYNLNNKLVTKMRKNIVAGNWKMNTTLPEGLQLAKEVNAALADVTPKCDVIIAVPFTHLASINAVINPDKLGLGAENCGDHRSGAYTGEVSAPMVASTGAKYVILGHSERRQYYGETSETLKEKVALALENGLTPIFCIGEVLEERENGTFFDVVKVQIEDALFGLSAEDFSKLILAYEPVWAIGTGKTATDDQAEEMHAFIRNVIEGKYGKEVAENTSILYGGSCKPTNAKALFAKPDVDGGLIGGASLKADSFMGIVNAFE